MTIYAYFTLTDTSGSSKRFRIIQGGYQPTLEKAQSVVRTMGGSLDVAMGDVYVHHRYVLWIRAQEEDANYGTVADLEHFYRLNNPGATPSNLLTLVDNYGVSHAAYFTGTFTKVPVSVFLNDTEAWYTIPVEFAFLT